LGRRVAKVSQKKSVRSNIKALNTALKRVEQDARAWRDVCDAVSEVFGAVGTIIMSIDPKFRGVWLFQSKILEPITQAYIADGWHLKDLRQKLAPKVFSEKFASDDDLGDRSVLMKHPYFHDFLAPRGLGFGTLIEVQVKEKHFVLSMQFELGRHPITEAEKALALEIRKMVCNTAARVAQDANEQFQNFVGMMTQTVDQLAVFDVTGRLTFCSGSGLEHFEPKSWPMDDISNACSADFFQYRPQHVIIEQAGQATRFIILQLPASLRHFFTENKVIVLVMKGQTSVYAGGNRLKVLYNLTPAELKCTELLAAGSSPAEIAAELGLQVSTIRQRLKSVLQKSGVSSQAKLVSLYYLQ